MLRFTKIGKLCNRFVIIRKAGTASQISLTQYTYQNTLDISADNYQLYYFTVDVKDDAGNLADAYSENIVFSIEGNAEIVGVDNGNSSDTSATKFADTSNINAFHGKALVIVKADKGQAFSLSAKSGDMQAVVRAGK